VSSVTLEGFLLTAEWRATARGLEFTLWRALMRGLSAPRHGPIDCAHQLDKQLAPAVDVVLGQLDTSYARVAGNQLELFSAS